MTAASRALVPTEKASRYLQQLCKHWSHKFEVRFDSSQGHIALPSGDADLLASRDTLSVTVTLKEGGDLERLQQVVADHINRFAFREGRELTFDWQSVEAAA